MRVGKVWAILAVYGKGNDGGWRIVGLKKRRLFCLLLLLSSFFYFPLPAVLLLLVTYSFILPGSCSTPTISSYR
ncbi:hypothetical protein RJT34_23413 [Clitoria ternatea]|uniref:Uncharacterized protein n=1 Tax=Clitoria ternatea TaxID=43366 RepID=A0AAN9FS10_CLITE